MRNIKLYSILIYIQQDATLHHFLIWKLLYIFRVVPPPIIRSANNCYLQHLVFVTPLLLPAAVEQFPDKINCVTLHLVRYILEYS